MTRDGPTLLLNCMHDLTNLQHHSVKRGGGRAPFYQGQHFEYTKAQGYHTLGLLAHAAATIVKIATRRVIICKQGLVCICGHIFGGLHLHISTSLPCLSEHSSYLPPPAIAQVDLQLVATIIVASCTNVHGVF